jgi:mono/diheme cytochrome c family protein
MRTVLKLLGVFVVLIVAVLLFIFSGLYDVSASTPDNGLIEWVLRTTQARSVHRASEALEGTLQVPDLQSPERIRTGLVHYHEMCATCHGAPGVKISEIGQGLNPVPPELATHGEDEPVENFWIVKHGIKMTGMPSFGVTHTDDEIWSIVAFLQRMPKMSPQEYQAMAEPSPPRPSSPDPSRPPSPGEEGERQR